MQPAVYAVIIGIIGLVFVLWLRKWVLSQEAGTGKIHEVHSWIKSGARAFLEREFITISYFIIAIVVGLCIISYAGIIAWEIPIGFVIGSLSSLLMAWLGMETATDANVRTAQAARKSPDKALMIAIRGGAVTGLSLMSIAIIGIGILYLLFGDPALVVGFGFGASLAALFAQLGGGIYTKSADVGADLVGKVEKKLEEDDPRNAAVIADLVGDNVGDCAGRASDLFESFSDNIITMMIVGAFLASIMFPEYSIIIIDLALVLQAMGLIASIVGVLAIRGKEPIKAIYQGFFLTGILLVIGFYIILRIMIPPEVFALVGDPGLGTRLWIATMLGMLGSLLTAIIVWYYTGPTNKPVKNIAEMAKGGPAIDILSGLSWGMESVVPAAIVVAFITVAAFYLVAGEFNLSGLAGIKGLFGVAVATLGLQTMAGIIQTSDTFGPIVDNADGIATMGGISEEVGTSLEKLDSVGNMTKALTKAYGMVSALLTSLSILFALIADYIDTALELGIIPTPQGKITFEYILQIANVNMLIPELIAGLIMGIAVPYVFTAWAIGGAVRGAFEMVNEVRRQFRENPAILEGKALPDYRRAVDIATRYALSEMIMPTTLGLFTPILIGTLFNIWVLVAYLIGLKISSALLAMFQFNTGGQLDNAKKLIEIAGKKGTEEHAAAVVGDTFGDPLKDTSGPSLHILIKLSNIFSITMIPYFIWLERIGDLSLRMLLAIGIAIIWIIVAIIARYLRKRTQVSL
ncbi:MAG: sodium-translocating pyrophosphatase [Candidatus Njordarchaeales archaeon]